MDNKGISKKTIILIAVISAVLLLVVLVLFKVFLKNNNSVVEKDGGTVVMSYTNENHTFYLFSNKSISNDDGMKLAKKSEYFDFSVNCKLEDSSSLDYEIVLESKEKTSLISKLNVYLEIENSGTYVKVFEPVHFEAIKTKSEYGAPVGSMVLSTVHKDKDSIDNYRLRVWVDESETITEAEAEKIALEINLYAKSA